MTDKIKNTSTKTKADIKAEQLAAALKKNLQRRKATSATKNKDKGEEK